MLLCTMHVSDWTIRHGLPQDEPCIATMWHRQLCVGPDAAAAGMAGAAQKGSALEQSFRAENDPIVTGLIRSAEVLVACDPDRADYELGLPAVIWAWVVLGPDTVYQVGIKRTAARAGIAEAMVRDMLGERLERRQVTVMHLVDMGKLRMIPKAWYIDPDWLPTMRRLARKRSDAAFCSVARHILDPMRVPWVPSSQRAA